MRAREGERGRALDWIWKEAVRGVNSISEQNVGGISRERLEIQRGGCTDIYILIDAALVRLTYQAGDMGHASNVTQKVGLHTRIRTHIPTYLESHSSESSATGVTVIQFARLNEHV